MGIKNLRNWWIKKNKELESLNYNNVNETTEELNTILFQESKPEKIQKIFSIRRNKTQKIIASLKETHVTELLFYVHEKSIFQILEYGIYPNPIMPNKKNLKKQEDINYLNHDNVLELELSNSNRSTFWKWVNDNDIDPLKIIFIGINVNTLFDKTTNNWTYNEQTKRIIISEPISPKCFNWILVRDYDVVDKLELIIKNQHLDLKLFYGETGQIEEKTT